MKSSNKGFTIIELIFIIVIIGILYATFFSDNKHLTISNENGVELDFKGMIDDLKAEANRIEIKIKDKEQKKETEDSTTWE